MESKVFKCFSTRKNSKSLKIKTWWFTECPKSFITIITHFFKNNWHCGLGNKNLVNARGEGQWKNILVKVSSRFFLECAESCTSGISDKLRYLSEFLSHSEPENICWNWVYTFQKNEKNFEVGQLLLFQNWPFCDVKFEICDFYVLFEWKNWTCEVDQLQNKLFLRIIYHTPSDPP